MPWCPSSWSRAIISQPARGSWRLQQPPDAHLRRQVAYPRARSPSRGLNRCLLSKSDAGWRCVDIRSCLPFTEVIARLGVPFETVLSFAKGGLLKADLRGRICTVTEEEVERFKREYATLPQLAQATGLRWGEVKNRLAEAGVPPPAVKRPEFKHFLFQRSRGLSALLERC